MQHETSHEMRTESRASASGLDGVQVAETKLSDVDGAAGRLIIAGHSVEALALQPCFPEVCARLWGSPMDPTTRDLGAARVRAFQRLPMLGDALATPDAMDGLRAAVAHLDGQASAAEVTGAIAVFAAAWARARSGLAPVAPNVAADHAADLLTMLTGHAPSAPLARAMNAYLVTVIDHGMNASTFAARVVASTGSDRVSAVVAGIGALKGPLHGGAPGPVLDMLDAIGHPEAAKTWIDAALDRGERIMGMGHRIYRVRDPRAFVLERAIGELQSSGIAGKRLALARAVERAAETALVTRHPDRPLKANVEFYTAVLLEALGVPRAMFTAIFACSRVAGWCAHIDEQRAVGRLIRPASRYVGAMPVDGAPID